MFCHSSGLTFNGASFHTAGRDMNIYNVNFDDYAKARELISQLQRLGQSIPPAVGHSHANALIIVDALGETLTIPWAIVSAYEVGIVFSGGAVSP
jgi:hypothetical protein